MKVGVSTLAISANIMIQIIKILIIKSFLKAESFLKMFFNEFHQYD